MTPSNTELREAIREIHLRPSVMSTYEAIADEKTVETMALFQTQKNQLLTEIVGKAEGVEYPHKRYGGDYEGEAVPVSVIEQYIKEMK